MFYKDFYNNIYLMTIKMMQIIKPHVSGTFAGLIVMDKLYRQKRYDAVIELFDKQFKDYSEEKSFSEMAPFMFRQKVPYDQLSCVIAALLALVSI